jgi:hypothetical protein
LRERDFENAMFENAPLSNKLENLANVFIGSSGRRQTGPTGGGGGQQNGYGPGTNNHPQLGGGGPANENGM